MSSDDTTPDETTSGQPDSQSNPDPWAATTDRPQYATHTRESAPAQPQTSTSSDAQTDQPPSSTSLRPMAGPTRVSVRAVGRRVRVVGDSGVATVSVDGPHVVRRHGSVVEISSEADRGSRMGGINLLRRPPRSLDDVRALGLGKELVVRINPELLLDCEVTAGSLHTAGVARLGHVRISAGSAQMSDVADIVEVLVQAGQTTLHGAITSGRSRIRVESGLLHLNLAATSDVTVYSDTQLGKIIWAGDQAGAAADEVVLGEGRARLDIEVVMGRAVVTCGDTHQADSA
jgi:hypothetical protein